MKEKEKVGLYIGVNSVGAAVIREGEVISLANFELSSLEADQALNEDIRWEALINKVLRRVGSNIENIYISLADKDFIFRSLQMPLMKRREVESSLVYEIEKYIPFKIKELEWDYEYTRLAKEQKINLSFIGIRENNIQRVKDILHRLKINALVIEPSCLSLLRVVKSVKSLSEFKNFALLDVTEFESYLTFFQNDLPVFNRYLTIPKKEDGFDSGEFIEAVNLSFQYFKSEFKTHKIERVIIAGSNSIKDLIPSLEEGLQIKTVHILPQDLSAQNSAEIESIKALGVAGRSHYPYEFKPVLRKTVEAGGKRREATDIPSFKLGLLGFLLIFGLISLFVLSSFMEKEVFVIKSALQEEEKLFILPPEFKGISESERMEIVGAKRNKVKTLEKITSSFKRISGFIAVLGRDKAIFPEGAWLKSVDILYEQSGYSGVLAGYIFCSDSYKERLALDELIANLRKSQAVQSIFPNIEISSSKKEPIEGIEVTSFSIRLKGIGQK
ncbi:MAG: pilus assembly protein PilM [Candidatus Omnitrophota bacterium]